MRVCVIGGNGNIGASIVRRLLVLGHHVTCFNRGKSGDVPEGAKIILGDRMDRKKFESTIQAQKFDAGIDMFCFNADDAKSSIRAFQGVSHLVHCSTVCTYGVEYDWLPVSESHPLRPTTAYGEGKVAADSVYMAAYHDSGFPVTIIKPSTTYGPRMGLLRQIGGDGSWIDRIRKGKPILVCGDGTALHQFMHVDDAALCFTHVLDHPHTVGQTYNMVHRGYMPWSDYHRTTMKIIGREVEMVGVPLAELLALDTPGVGIAKDIFSHNTIYSSEKLFRDVAQFQPSVSLEDGISELIEIMDGDGRITDSDEQPWEDQVIAAQKSVRGALVA